MSRWRHNICWPCWAGANPEREPARLVQPDRTECCYCGGENQDGIYTREDPAAVRCLGAGSEHVES